jgi:alpha-tubulin suppressor-like RCC1 family protein
VSALGRVFTWGCNHFLQTGHATTSLVKLATEVPGLAGVAAVDCGGFHTAAVAKSGAVYAWGCNRHGQCGGEQGFNVGRPRKVPGLTERSRQVRCGFRSTRALTKAGGRVLGWGIKVSERYEEVNDLNETSVLTVKQDSGQAQNHWHTDLVPLAPEVSASPKPALLDHPSNGWVEDEECWGGRTGLTCAWSETMQMDYLNYYVDAKAEETAKKVRRAWAKQSAREGAGAASADRRQRGRKDRAGAATTSFFLLSFASGAGGRSARATSFPCASNFLLLR